MLLVAVLAGLGWSAFRLWSAWGDVSRVAFDPETARDALGAGATSTTSLVTTTVAPGAATTTPVSASTVPPAPGGEKLQVFLIIGSDERSPLDESRRADAIMLFILPEDGIPPVLVSIPRDLQLRNPCTGGLSRINANLNGCGDSVSGPEQLAIAIEDFTGLAIDHFVLFTFEGFRNIVDRVGGVQICTPVAVRDDRVDPVPLELPAGCTTADGDQTLAWVRSRHTEGFVDGDWVSLASNDLDRNERQQDVFLEALQRLSAMRDVSELTALAEELAAQFTVDEGLGLSNAVATAWRLRALTLTGIIRPVLPVAAFVDDDGRSVLVVRDSFENVVVGANPAMADYFESA